MKVDVALLLIELLKQVRPHEIWERERCFYSILETVGQYGWGTFFSTETGKKLLAFYHTHINPTFSWQFKNPQGFEFRELLQLTIQTESHIRREVRLTEARNIEKYLKGVRDHGEVLDRLTTTFGPFRLLIVSVDSGEVTTSHNLDPIERERLKKEARYSSDVDVLVYDRLRKYRIVADYGSEEPKNQFVNAEFNSIIQPAIIRYIEKQERIFFALAMDNMTEIDSAEESMKGKWTTYDYSHFVSRMSQDIAFDREVHPDFARICTQAIDICQRISLSYPSTSPEIPEKLMEEVDSILWWKIERSVLHMARSLLLSRHETMSGTGYPHGLSKRNIPLEWKIYSIVRTYEALSRNSTSQKKVFLLCRNGRRDDISTEILCTCFLQA